MSDNIFCYPDRVAEKFSPCLPESSDKFSVFGRCTVKKFAPHLPCKYVKKLEGVGPENLDFFGPKGHSRKPIFSSSLLLASLLLLMSLLLMVLLLFLMYLLLLLPCSCPCPCCCWQPCWCSCFFYYWSYYYRRQCSCPCSCCCWHSCWCRCFCCCWPYCCWRSCIMMLQYDVRAVACCSLAHAGKLSGSWRETFIFPHF